jgi:hypothetical protein
MPLMKKPHRLFSLLTAITFLFLSGLQAQEAVGKLKVVTEMANVRLKPDIGSVIIHQVPQGTSLETTAKEGEWYLVRIQIEEGQEATGYVHESTVIVIERPPTVVPKKEPVPEPEKVVPEKVVPEKKVTVPQKAEEEKTEEKEKAEEEPQIQPIPEPPPLPQPSESRPELWLLGGGTYVQGGDLNSGAQGFIDYYRDKNTITQEFEAEAVHLSYIYGGEFTLPIGSNFFLGFGADYFLRETEGLLELREIPALKIQTRPRIEALPLRLFISFYPVRFFYLKTGIEYYFARCEYFYRLLEDTTWKEWHGKAKAQGSGILAAMGLDIRLTSEISFVLEATSRFAKISGFKGTDRSKDSNGNVYEEGGTLYFYKAKGSMEEPFPLLFIKLREPPEDFIISDPRRAIIDFSGVSLKAGFRLRF